MAAQKPNLLFVMTDHQRVDSLGMVQAGIEVTPNLNRLAGESAFFTRAYNTAPLCVPTRTALFTGKHPMRNGVVFNDFKGVTAQDHVTFQQCLAEAGYDVAHVGIDHVRVRPPYRERNPFAFWVSEPEHRQYLIDTVGDAAEPPRGEFQVEIVDSIDGKPVRRMFSSTRTAVWPHDAEHFKDLYWCRKAIEFLRQPHERPFALFLFLWAPHPPLRVPEPYFSMFDPDRLELPANVGQVPPGEPSNRRHGIAGQLGRGISMEQWRKVWAAHLGLVRLADEGIGRVLRTLEDSGHRDDTILAFTVDHGDFLGQRRMYQKFEIYEQAVRMPLLLRLPGGEPARFETPVSHLDIVPTLLELMEVPSPEGLDGLSLAECLRQGCEPPERPVFCEFCGSGGRDMNRRAVITRRYKYVYDPEDIAELYDLERDPLEMENLAQDPGYASVVREMHEQCREWAKRCGDWIRF